MDDSSVGVLQVHRPGREVDHDGGGVLDALLEPFRLLEGEDGHLAPYAVVALRDHAHVLREVVADAVERLLEPEEEVLARGGDADVHRMRRVDVERALLVERGHLDVHACVDLAGEVGLRERVVRRILHARYVVRVLLELAADALCAERAGEDADSHAAPRRLVAGLEPAAALRPEVDAEHPDRRVRIQELLAARGREAEPAYDVELPGRDVREALLVRPVDVVEGPVRARRDGVEPFLYDSGPVARRRDAEEVPAPVRRHAHAVLLPRHAEHPLPQLVVPFDVVDVALAVRPLESHEELVVALLHGEVDLARAYGDDLDESLGALPLGRVQEEQVDRPGRERLYGLGACRELDVLG